MINSQALNWIPGKENACNNDCQVSAYPNHPVNFLGISNSRAYAVGPGTVMDAGSHMRGGKNVLITHRIAPEAEKPRACDLGSV